MKTRIEKPTCCNAVSLMFVYWFAFLLLYASPVFSQNQVQQQIMPLNQQTIPLHQLQLQQTITLDTMQLQAAQPQFQAPVQQISPAMQNRPNYKDNLHFIEDTTSQLTIQVFEGNRVREETRSLSGFRLKDGEDIAVVWDKAEMREVESKGAVIHEGREIKLQGVALPEIYMARVKSTTFAPAHGAPSTEQALLRVLVDTFPVLAYNERDNNYTGQFYVMLLDDSQEYLVTNELVSPVPFQFSSSLAVFDPQHASIGHTNMPTTSVKITDDSPYNPVPIKIMTSFNPQGYVTYLAKQALIRIETPPRSLQGFGVQAIPITITLHNYLPDDSVRINLVSTLGSISPDHIYVSRDKAAQALLKSEGTGSTTVRANADGFLAEEARFTFIFPWIFILLTLVGGVIGAILKHLLNPKEGKLSLRIVQGFLAGFFVGILYYVVGLNVFSFDFGRVYFEFAVLALAIMGALFWEKIYDGLAKVVAR
jgi:hypothetical protein